MWYSLLRFLGISKRSTCAWTVGVDPGQPDKDYAVFFCTVHRTVFDRPTDMQQHLLDNAIRKAGR